MKTYYFLHFLLGIGIAMCMLCFERHFILQLVLGVGIAMFIGTAYEAYGNIVHKAKTDWNDVLWTGAGALLYTLIDFVLQGFFTYESGDSTRGFMWWKLIVGVTIILITYFLRFKNKK